MRKDNRPLSDDDPLWLELDGDETNLTRISSKNKENSPASASKRPRQKLSPEDSPKNVRRFRPKIGLSVRQTIQSRSENPPINSSIILNTALQNSPGVPDEVVLDLDSIDAQDLNGVRAQEYELVLDDEINGENGQSNNLPLQQQAVEVVQQQPRQPLYLDLYPNQNVECPDFLNLPINHQHKIIVEILNRGGERFLCNTRRGNRYWGLYPSHEKTYFQPMSDVRHQIYFPSSPRDIIYKGTWVTAVAKDANGKNYPLHIITKGTLGGVNNLLQYPARFQKIFEGEEFLTHWPEGLGKECVVVCVDNLDQQRQLIRGFEDLVNLEGRRGLKTIPNLRVFCQGELSELKTVENCRQRNLFAMMRPNLLPYAERKQVLLELERREIDARQGLLSKNDFDGVCAQFFSPAPLSHELALTHFSLTQLRHFYGALTQSRKRMIELKGSVVSHYKGIQMEDPTLKQFLAEMDQSIQYRTRTINKLADLDQRYVQYSMRLAHLFELRQNLSTEEIEAMVLHKVQEQIDNSGIQVPSLDTHFGSGKAFVAWLLTHQIPIPENNPQSFINSVVEQMPRANNFNQIRVY